MIKHTQDELTYQNSWHDKILGEYQIRDSTRGSISFSLYTTPSGCGSVIMRGYHITGEITEDILRDLEKIFQRCKDNGVGMIMTTLGQSFFDGIYDKLLKDIFGMVCVSEYNNYRHNSEGKYKQRLYVKTL